MDIWPVKNYLSIASTLALGFGILFPLPASASIVEDCVGNQCTVTFTYSGQMQTFTPPANAKNFTFDALGAQGGRTGGGGGRVAGVMTLAPEVLYIFVGGAGGGGANAPGGFNGGGTAGSGSDMEGSGGGASDIRTGPELSSRIVVAGGGGARGAGLGSGGGAGGGLLGATGRNAQGFGGIGGSQTSGGAGGAANGSGSSGLAGSLGVGGTGGSSVLYGGGGGGGGYFGGGGGGSDSDSCCTDAGGGGGGSSYTDGAWITNASHTQGFRQGAGQVVLFYQLAPTITSISSAVSGDQVSFQIEFDTAISGFEVSDLDVSHSAGSCSGNLLSGSGQSYQLLLTGCDDGEVSIAVIADSVSGSEVSGPMERFSSGTVLIDTLAPSASWGQTSALGSTLEFTEPIGVLDLDAIDFTAAGETCSLAAPMQESATTWQLSTSGCEQSSFTLSLRSLSVADSSGNRGPASAITTSFEALVPEPPAPEPVTPEVVEEPVVEPAPNEAEQDQVAPDPKRGEVQEITPTPSEPVLPPEPVELPREIWQPDSFELLLQPEPVVLEQVAIKTTEPETLPGVGNQEQVEVSREESNEGPGSPSIFISPPATSLPQASQAVTIPAQSMQRGEASNELALGLLMLGLFALGAGLIVARRGIPGALSS